MPALAFMYPSIWEPSVKICSNLSWGYLVFIVSKARCLSVSVPVSPFIMLCCRCRQHSTGSMSTGFRRWGLLLISNFVFISVTFCINPFCVFRFRGLFTYVFQYWSSKIMSSFSCSSTALSSINSCIGLLSVMKVIASVGVVFTAPIISLRAWFWACSSTRWFKYDRDWFVCKQAALRSSCATLREWSHNLHPPSCSG